MEKFSSECFREVVDQELHVVGSVFRSPAGNNVKEETLTGFSLKEVIPESVQHLAPNLWSALHGLAYTKSQITRKSSKNPEKVEYTVALLKLKSNSDSWIFYPYYYFNALIYTKSSPWAPSKIVCDIFQVSWNNGKGF
jgi:hypothetical protein